MSPALKSTELSLPADSGKSQRFKPVQMLNRDVCKKEERRSTASESQDPGPWLKSGQELQAYKWKELNSAKNPKGAQYICLQNHKPTNPNVRTP